MRLFIVVSKLLVSLLHYQAGWGVPTFYLNHQTPGADACPFYMAQKFTLYRQDTNVWVWIPSKLKFCH